MKAYQIAEGYHLNSLSLIEKSIPKLLPNQVLVKMSAVSLNYRDLLVIDGVGNWRPPVGRIPISDGVGVVVETGTKVRSLTVGDRVAGLFLPNWIDGKLTKEKLLNPLGGRTADGLLQEYVVFNEEQVIKVPAFLSDEAASTLPCAGLTAWHGLMEKGNVNAGDVVLIQGTGGVSMFSIQFALMQGARVILLSSSDEKLDFAKKMGVPNLINYRSTPSWESQVMEITEGKGVDHVVEVVGGDNINRSIEVISLDGTISVIGLLNGLPGHIDASKIMSKQIRVHGIEVGSKEMFHRMNIAIEQNHIHPIVNEIYPFSDARKALHTLQTRAHLGKISIKF